jgi:ER-bound oxygenase mpaB/B'/Rubber oxygenase, catalytic domain
MSFSWLHFVKGYSFRPLELSCYKRLSSNGDDCSPRNSESDDGRPRTKLDYGSSLTSSELRYLRCNDHYGPPFVWNSAYLADFHEALPDEHCYYHLETEMLEPYRLRGDSILDPILDLLRDRNELFPGTDVLQLAETAYFRRNQLSTEEEREIVNDHQKRILDDLLYEFFAHHYEQENIPGWVDWDRIAAGQTVFAAYSPAIALSLFYRSLVPGFSIPKIAAVLLRTAYLAPPASTQNIQNRLLDTGAFLAASCMPVDVASSSPQPAFCNETSATPVSPLDPLFTGSNTLQPGGPGWKTALQVRVLHAKVRHQILSKQKKSGATQRSNIKGAAIGLLGSATAKQTTAVESPTSPFVDSIESNAWDTESLGVPINQEDLAATLLAFSTNVLWGIEFILGMPLSTSETNDYLLLWRYLGWLLGVETIDDCDERKISCGSQYAGYSVRLPPLDPCGPGWRCSDYQSAVRNSKERIESHKCTELRSAKRQSWETEMQRLRQPEGYNAAAHVRSYLSSPSYRHSVTMFESMLCHLMHPDRLSITIAHHLLRMGRRDVVSSSESRHQQHQYNHFFYFRSILCRRCVGDKLADALEVPYHPRWHYRIFRNGISYLYLCLLRIYTAAALPGSPFRPMIVRFHSRNLQSFFKFWRSTHMQRLSRGLAPTKTSSASDMPSINGEVTDSMPPLCPFAMLNLTPLPESTKV